jgi:5'-methylthioadenosine phosphorylase
MKKPVLGIIGGSGLYDLPGLVDMQWVDIASPWGDPSDQLLRGRMGDTAIAFLPRHGRGHKIPPHRINFRANIDVLKRAGVTHLVSVSAVGSYKAELYPGLFVLPDQYVDRTQGRPLTFFDEGVVAHVSFAHPVSPLLQRLIMEAAQAEEIPCKKDGTLMVMNGPQFSTRAESLHYKDCGFDLVGMTAMPEAKLAREAELPYATLAMVTDFDCWHPDHDAVTVEAVVAMAHENAGNAKRLIARLAKDFPKEPEICPSGAENALDAAIQTAKNAVNRATLTKLDAIAGRVLGAQ